MKISAFTKRELDALREECNLTPIERQCFDLKAKDYTNVQLAMELNISESTVSVTMRRVRAKVTKVMSYMEV